LQIEDLGDTSPSKDVVIATDPPIEAKILQEAAKISERNIRIGICLQKFSSVFLPLLIICT
jgi:hypothetical protein